nr:hypothetical protein [Tanacetum cinerariifolium]
MGNVKKFVAERTRHKRQYDRRMNERQMQSRESKVVSSKALNASLVVTECSGTNGLIPQPPSPIPNLPPTKNDWDTVFCLLFDEYFNPPPRSVSPVPVAVAAPRAVDPVGAPSSTTIDQDVPSASTSPTIQEI